MRRMGLHFGVLTLFMSCALYGQVKISVKNPSTVSRVDEPVVVPWAMIHSKLSDVGHVSLQDEQGNILPLQVDDMDLDGTPEELTFVATFEGGQERAFTVLSAGKVITSTRYQFTDAQNYKRPNGVLQAMDDDDVSGTGRERKAYRFDGVGWESEIVGYRLYLDERNATDIQGKRIPGLYWKWIGESGVDYQLDAFWGMDVLHVGRALGIGGIGFWVGDSVLKPLTLDRQRSRIVARGPVRAVVRIDYFGWDVGNDKVDVTSLFSIYAHDRVSEHQVILGKSRSPKTLVTGIVTHDSTETFWNPEGAWLYTVGHQSRSNDTLLMALTLPPSSVIKKTEDANNKLVLLKTEQSKPLHILISSYWQGENGKMWGKKEIDDFITITARRLSEPLTVQIR